MTDTIKLTPNQTKIMGLMEDGLPHHKTEIRELIGDEYTADSAVKVALSSLRKRINPHGYDVAPTVVNGKHSFYRLVRLIVK